jgi:hypothetical protein
MSMISLRFKCFLNILRSISEGKNENQMAERFDGNSKLVRICIDALSHLRFITRNSFNELVVTLDGEKYLEKFDSNRVIC